MRNTAPRTSIRQVAERAGVSPMTVTNVLRDRAGEVSPQTQKRVLQAVDELGYIPVRSVMQNRHVSTNAIGVLFLQDMKGAVGYPTFLGICDRAQSLDHDLTILLRREPLWSNADIQFLDRRCDGFIFVGDAKPELRQTLVTHRIPLVECYSVSPPQGVARILGDNRQAMHLAVQCLVQAGHTKIAHFGGPKINGEAQQRAEAFCDAMQSASLSDNLIICGDTWGDRWGFDDEVDEGGETRPLARALLDEKPTAVVCANDLLALTLWKEAERRGLSVPGDLSIIGMDNLVQAAAQGLTSVSVPFDAIGEAAVEAVISLIHGGSAESASRVLPVSLIPRKTVGPAKP